MGANEGKLIEREIQRINNEAHPSTVRELVRLVKTENPKYSTDEILVHIQELAGDGYIVLAPRRFEGFQYFWTDFHWNFDFWIILILCVASLLSLLITVSFPWSLFRLVFIIPLFFYLPGHSLLRIFSSRSSFTLLERTLLAFAASLVLVLLVGLLLNFSNLGFFAIPTVSVMVLLDLVLGFLASYQYYSVLQPIS